MFHYRLQCVVSLGVVSLIGLFHGPVWADALDPAFEKALDVGQSLTLTQEDVPYVPLSPQELQERRAKFEGLVKKFPNAVYIASTDPDRNKRYSIFLTSKGGKTRRLVWQRVISEYLTTTILGRTTHHPEQKFFDVALDGNSVIVVHRMNNQLVGEVVEQGSHFETRDISPQWVLPEPDPNVAKTLGTPVADEAKIEGSLANHDLTVVAQTYAGEKRYLWKDNAWVKVETPPAPPIPAKTLP